ncbi:hypothetical protein ACQR1Y_12265 [Bradyrhizobium sp. HKCCYLRH3099]|uniref:hypothetical protein n=1 Tax=unclassified Bradyrhizobium TaxID=2631580 RepID=UPI003EB7F4D0
MGSFTKLGAEIWRYFVTDGVPASGPWKVRKDQMQVWMAEVEAQTGNFFDNAVAMAGSGLIDNTMHKAMIVLPADGTSIVATLSAAASLRSGFAVGFHNPKASTRFHRIVVGSDTIRLPPGQSTNVFRVGTGPLLISDMPRRHRAQGLTVYQDTAGDDASDGLVISEPKKTIKSAAGMIWTDIDLQNAESRVQVSGTTTEAVSLSGQATGYNYIKIRAASLGASTWNAGPEGYCLLVGDNAEAILENIKVQRGTLTKAILLATHQPGVLDIFNCEVGDAGATGVHFSADHGGSSMNFDAYTVSGAAAVHLSMGGACSGTQTGGVTITITNTPIITTWFSLQGSGANFAMGGSVTYSGSVAAGCTKYLVSLNASLSLGGNTVPGSIAGSATAGGQVVA